MVHPLQRKGNLQIYFLVWLLLFGIHFAISLLVYKFPVVPALLDAFISSAMLQLIATGLGFTLRSQSVSAMTSARKVMSNILAAMVLLAIWFWTCSLIYPAALQSYPDELAIVQSQKIARAIIGGILILFFALVFFLMQVYEDLTRRRKEEADLRLLIREAEIKALKSQINPHFLFNSLNSISALTTFDAARARSMLVKLSDFMRYSLKMDYKALTTFEKELENMKRYLEIEKVRFEDRLTFLIETDEECLTAQLPNLALQPILENAVKYGVYENQTETCITLRAIGGPSNLSVTIQNNYDPTAHTRKGAGIGQENLRRRMELIYRRSDLIQIRSSKYLYSVTLNFPQPQEDPNYASAENLNSR